MTINLIEVGGARFDIDFHTSVELANIPDIYNKELAETNNKV